MPSPPQLRHLQANGLRFACLEAGHGPLVLCLHGFPDTAHSFSELLPALAAAGYRAVAPFMRGYAPTGLAPDGDYSATALGRDVLALIEALGEPEATVIGHDWGAYAAYCAANLDDAARIRRLVLMSVPHLAAAVNTWVQLRRSWYVWFFQLPGLPEQRVARDDFAFIERLYRAWSPGWPVGEAELRPVKQALAAPGGLAAAIGYYRAMFRHASRQNWAVLTTKTSVPTLMLAGVQDGAVGVETLVRSAEAFTNPDAFTFHALPGVGHFPHREAVTEVNRLILDFLSRNAVSDASGHAS